MKTYRGLIASPGIAIALIKKYAYIDALSKVPEICIAADPSVETSKVTHALLKVKERLASMRSPYAEQELIDALGFIAEGIVQEALSLINSDKICGSLAIKKVYEKYAEIIKTSGSQLFALREADLKTITEMLIKEILAEDKGLHIDTTERVIVSEELGIIEFFELLRQRIKGLITKSGGVTSHIAIVARSNNVPYIIIPKLDINELKDDSHIILDAIDGIVIVEPDEVTIRSYRAKAESYRKIMEQIAKYAYEEAITSDNYTVDILCNVGNLEEARLASTLGCKGIGLFRIEFIYMRNRAPNVSELHEVFNKAASFFEGKPVVIRAPDIGGDKPVPYLVIREENPFMGLRGIRLLLEYKEELFRPFLEAFLRAYREHDNLRLLLPMVSRVSEVLETVELINEVAKKLSIDISKLKLGIMVEVPSTAILIDKFAETGNIHFISYGTNDLTQYVLAVDRTNPKVGVIYDDLDPSILRLLNISINNAVKNKLEVEVCGELASRQLAVPILLAFGVNALSVNYNVVGIIKYTVRGTSVEEVRKQLLPHILDASNSQEVKEILKQYLLSKGLTILG